MYKPVTNDQQTQIIRDENETLTKFQLPGRAGGILKIFNRIINRLTGFIQLTEEEQREAGVYPDKYYHD